MHLGITDRVKIDAVAVELVCELLFLRLAGSLFTHSCNEYCTDLRLLANYLAHVNTAKSFQ